MELVQRDKDTAEAFIETALFAQRLDGAARFGRDNLGFIIFNLKKLGQICVSLDKLFHFIPDDASLSALSCRREQLSFLVSAECSNINTHDAVFKALAVLTRHALIASTEPAAVIGGFQPSEGTAEVKHL